MYILNDATDGAYCACQRTNLTVFQKRHEEIDLTLEDDFVKGGMALFGNDLVNGCTTVEKQDEWKGIRGLTRASMPAG